jgi:hypothetical protein
MPTKDQEMRFEDASGGWQEKRQTQEETTKILGVSDRTLRHYVNRYEDSWLEKLLSQHSRKRAPGDDVIAFQEIYCSIKAIGMQNISTPGKSGRRETEFHLGEEAVAGSKADFRDLKERSAQKRREQAALPGMMVHQDAGSQTWKH